MSHAIDKSEAALQQAYHELETRLKDLTHELQSANQTLQNEIGRRQRVQEALENTQQRQLQMKDDFLSHVSHELRTPLSVMHQFLTIVLDDLAGELNNKQRHYLEIVLRNVHQLRAMINDLIDATRSDTGKLRIQPECCFAKEIVAQAAVETRQKAASENITVKSKVSAKLPPIYADSVRFRQVLANLLDNAVKFTPEGGTITIEAKVHKEDNHFVCFSVKDTGAGIDSKVLPRLFQRLYQKETMRAATRKGLGLGLFICKTLVERHKGRIWAESKPGKGSAFHFTMPVFSLNNLLVPILTKKKKLPEAVALMDVTVSLQNRSLSPEKVEDRLREGRDLLMNCIQPSQDFLLPRIARTKNGETFFLVVAADPQGVQIISRRINEEWDLRGSFQSLDSSIDISSTSIDLPSINGGGQKALEKHAEKIVANIEQLVREKADKVGGLYGVQ